MKIAQKNRGICQGFFSGIFLLTAFILPAGHIQAQTIIHYNASDLAPHTQISVTPASGSFQENSTFEVPVFVNTKGNNINAIELHVSFDPKMLSVIKPSGGKSIIGIWVEPPSYDNSKGAVKVIGTIPGGIVSDSGLIVTVTFKALKTGQTTVSVTDQSQVLLNNGLGTPTILESSRGAYTIVPVPPGGVTVYSDTHPFQSQWYNNNNPVVSWNKDPGVVGFSYTLDNQPNTVPGNNVSGASTTSAYENLGDGLWYFHVKALRQGVWGNTSHFALHIDTTPPAEFTPHIDYVYASVINRFLVSFFTTDALSGVDHYEVGVIDKSKAATESPVFVETESPYQLPLNAAANARVIVRAFDKAGNARDQSIDASVPFLPWKYITDHLNAFLLALLALIILYSLIHYLFGHHIISRIRRIRALLQREEQKEEEKEELADVKKPLPSSKERRGK